MSAELIRISRALGARVGALSFGPPVTHVYNPLVYARESHEDYLRRFGSKTGRVVWMGMNPGPWGMAQTGVPFGEVAHVRDWMGVQGHVGKPEREHPKRPVLGFECPRSEVSGRRLWGWAAERFETADAFFDRFFVLNYCPLSFMEEGGRNRIPEKLPAVEREPLFAACDDALRQTLEVLQPSQVIGVGGFAEKCLRRVTTGLPVGRVLHPSPASPAANRGWVAAAERDLARHGIAVAP